MRSFIVALSWVVLRSEAVAQLQSAKANSSPAAAPTVSTASKVSFAAPAAAPAASSPVSFSAEPPALASRVTSELSSAATGIPSGSCKWVPGQSGWPTDADFAELNRQVQGRLSKPAPPAAACHLELGAGGNCQSVKNGFGDSAWHARNPVSNMWQNYNNYSCMPSGGECTTEGYPVYVVAARDANDVKAAVDFARNMNIRLNIKSTGHDFLGRSVQPFSLSIWTRNLNSQRWFTSGFKPKGCSFTIPGASVTAGAGNQWQQVTSAAGDRGLMVVSGAFGTVSLGGFLSNGGHGGLSAKYGLGADMVQEIELVTPSGEIMTANECQNTDYFWAMRGGGGSTYGVALAYNLRALPSVRSARYRTSLEGWDEIVHWYRNWDKIAMIGGSGYFDGYPGAGDTRGGHVGLNFNVPNMSQSALEAVVNPIMDSMRGSTGGRRRARGRSDDDDDDDRRKHRKRAEGATTYARKRGAFQEFATWDAAQAALEARSVERERGAAAADTPAAFFPGMGVSKVIASWLWSAEDLRHPNMSAALRGAFDDSGQMLNDATVGVGVHRPPYQRGSNAVNPAFRTAVMRPATELQWTGTDLALLESKMADAVRFTASYASIDPQGGTYANEATPNIPNWQHAFWGDNYPRLLEIKKRVDPHGVFYCRSCVGSELWNDNGQLCRL